MAATKTTGEAFDLLKETRAEFIKSARDVANGLIELEGSTHVRRVLEVMKTCDLVDPQVKDYWLGPVFSNKRYEWTGEWHLPPAPETGKNIHAWRPVKVWSFA